MSFSFNPKQTLQSGPLMSQEMKNVQDQLAMIMQSNAKNKSKKINHNNNINININNNNNNNDDYSVSPSREQNDEEFSDSRYSQVIQNGQNIPDEGLVNQTQNLMQDIIRVMKDQDLNNQLQLLTDQEIAKPVSNFDLKDMINRMHNGISSEQQKLQNNNNRKSYQNNNNNNSSWMNQSSMLNKSSTFGGYNNNKSKSKSPVLSSRTQTIIQKKKQSGEYKPIYERLDEIKQHHYEVVMKTTRMFPKKEEPIPTFQPSINKNTEKIMQNKSRTGQNWDQFLKGMRDWDEKKVSVLREKQVEKAIKNKQIHTFHPVINPSTSAILEKSEVFGNDYCPEKMQNVVNRLYSRMKEKSQRDKQRLQECMSHSPFKPKINSNSEKLFYKMCNGVKVPFEERIKQKHLGGDHNKSKSMIGNQSQIINTNRNNINNNTLDPIQENQQALFNINNQGQKSQDNLSKSVLLQNSASSSMNMKGGSFFIKDTPQQQNNNQNSLNQSIYLMKGGVNNSSFLNTTQNTNNNNNNLSNINNNQSPEQKRSIVSQQQLINRNNESQNINNKSKSKDMSNSSNKKQINQKKQQLGNENYKENSYHILITDGDCNNYDNQSQLTGSIPSDSAAKTKQHIKSPSNIKNKTFNSPHDSNHSLLESNKIFTPAQKNKSNNNNSQVQLSNNKLVSSINFSAKKSLNYDPNSNNHHFGMNNINNNNNNNYNENNNNEEEQLISPQKNGLNLSYNIRSPKLNHSPLKKSATNYTMTVQNIKASKDNLSSASKFEVLNTQISPLKDLNNTNDVEYGQNLKYIINLLRKEDPSFLTTSQKGNEQQQSQQQIQSGKKNEQKSSSSPRKKI